MQYSYRQSDADLWLYENNDIIMRNLRYDNLKNQYNQTIARYLTVRSELSNDIIDNAKKNMGFLESVFKAHGYEDIDIKVFVSRDNDSLELIGMSFEELLLKLAIVNRLCMDVECLINYPKIISRYSAQDLYTAVRIIEKKYKSNLSSSDLALMLYLRGRQRYDTDDKLTKVRKFMYSKGYLDHINSKLSSEKLEDDTGEELVLRQC